MKTLLLTLALVMVLASCGHYPYYPRHYGGYNYYPGQEVIQTGIANQRSFNRLTNRQRVENIQRQQHRDVIQRLDRLDNTGWPQLGHRRW